MKIFSAAQTRDWDKQTMTRQQISSLELMERASQASVTWLEGSQLLTGPVMIFCGKGNNGGDGLAIARLLANSGCEVSVHILEFGQAGTEDFQANLRRLHELPAINIYYIQDESHFPAIPLTGLIIDALLGTGLNRALEGLTAAVVDYINRSGLPVVAIDIPSGMFADQTTAGKTMIKANYTLCFESMKMAFFLPENNFFTGSVQVLPIGLDPEYAEQTSTMFETIDIAMARAIYKPRSLFAHKGNFGHALLLAGSDGKNGAAIIAATSCLRAGAGLLTCSVTRESAMAMNIALPEAMTALRETELDYSNYDAIAIGPGIGTDMNAVTMLKTVVDAKPSSFVIDADGINILSTNSTWLNELPDETIITPHPKEFERLFGKTSNDFERVLLAEQKARQFNLVIILKGHHTLIALPGGKAYFNTTGNPGMATAGSGDSLTGILLALRAQGYDAAMSSILGVYIHGLAGDLAAREGSEESLIAGDIAKYLGKAFRLIQ